MARRRSLRPEELDLWQAVARTARPLHGIVAPHPVVIDQGLKAVPEVKARAAVPRFRMGEKAVPFRVDDSLPTPALQMDAKAFTRMSKGKLVPEARLDLHGMTVSEAHPELIRFILNASSEGLRLVLVITGKGKPGPDFGPIPQRYGVLKHQVPNWLRMPPLGAVILQVSEAHLKHGGAGALYVYLRRLRG
jgi:DNA-nicking Smr family endonuclease